MSEDKLKTPKIYFTTRKLLVLMLADYYMPIFKSYAFLESFIWHGF